MISTKKHVIKRHSAKQYQVFRLVRNYEGEVIKEIPVGSFEQLDVAVRKLVEQLRVGGSNNLDGNKQ